MPGKVYNNCYVAVNGTALSDLADRVTVESTLDSVDVTGFGSSNKIIAPGLGDATVSCDFFLDYTSGKTIDTLKAMHIASRNGTAGTVEVWPVNSTPSSTNPRIQMVAFLMNFTGLDASVGAAGKTTANFSNAGTAGITYGTS